MTQDVVPLSGYRDPYGLLCAILQDATADWRIELDWTREFNIGPEIVIRRLRPGGPSIGAIILHMVVAEVFWFERFVLGRPISPEDKAELMWDEIDVDSCTWPDPPHEGIRWYFDLADRYRSRTLKAIEGWPEPEKLMEHDGRRVSARWVLGHVIQHESYHGGQIVMLHDHLRCSDQS